MRHIAKNSEPEAFRLWKHGTSDNWNPSWAALGGTVKDALRTALLREQGFLCCYCERRIASDGNEEGGCHIEHLESRKTAPHQDLEYENLLCSCTASRSEHCGMKKDRDSIAIHPLQQDCTTAFRFHSDGSVEARSGDRLAAANSTLATLGLNNSGLKARRRKAIEDFLKITRDLPLSEVKKATKALSAHDEDGRFVPFATAVQGIVLP